MLDGYGRTLDHLRISVTERCNMRCSYCKPAGGSGVEDCGGGGAALSAVEIETIVARLVAEYGITHLRLTGGEPTVRGDLVEVVSRLARLSVSAGPGAPPGVREVAMTSNGTRLAALAQPLKAAGLTRLNISVDTLRPARLEKISPGTRLEAVLTGIAAARAAGFRDLKFNAVLMRGVNDDEIVDLIRFAAAQGGQMRFIELMPIGVMAGQHAARLVSAAEIRAVAAAAFEIVALPRPAGSPAQPYAGVDRRTGVAVRFGIIASESEPFCADCRRLRLTADGRLMGCLFREEGSDLRPWLAARHATAAARSAAFRRLVEMAAATKPMQRRVAVKHAMYVVGG